MIKLICYIAIAIFCSSVQAVASDLYVCHNSKDEKEYRNTGDVSNCKKINIPPEPAKKWVGIGFDKNSSTYIDSTSAMQTGNYLKAWFLTTYNNDAPQTDNLKTYQSELTLYYFSCIENTLQTVQKVMYSGQNASGEVVSAYQSPMKLERYKDVVPGSLGAAALNAACSSVGAQKRK
jgi:hypothetical protein